MSREEIMTYLKEIRSSHPVADLAFYSSRDLSITDTAPFLKAAFERNPVCIEETKELSDAALIKHFEEFTNESIYDGSRVAQPDEIWNFQRGDGFECAITLANIWRSRYPEAPIGLNATGNTVTLTLGEHECVLKTSKALEIKQAL
jgi:hypothetical protein